MCCLALGELAWLFHEPHTRFEDFLNILLSCFRKRMSACGCWMVAVESASELEPESPLSGGGVGLAAERRHGMTWVLIYSVDRVDVTLEIKN